MLKILNINLDNLLLKLLKFYTHNEIIYLTIRALLAHVCDYFKSRVRRALLCLPKAGALEKTD